MASDFQHARITNNAREVTVVEVKNAVTHDRGLKTFTDFEVCIKTTNKAFIISQSSVRRRYSDFVWLRNWLQKNNEGFSYRKTPTLPPKKLVHRFDEEFIKERMKGLQRFLRKVIEHNVYLSDKALHLFLQSAMSVHEIENYMSGKSRFPTKTSSNSMDCQEEKHNRSDQLQKIIEIPNTPGSESLMEGSSYSSIGSFTDSFEKITAKDCSPSQDKSYYDYENLSDTENELSTDTDGLLANTSNENALSMLN